MLNEFMKEKSMNVYDQAHGLAAAIKESEEYKHYQASKRAVEANPQLKEAVDDFMKKQFELQAAAAMGNQPDPSQMQQIQQLSAVLMQDPTAAGFMQNQITFSMMIADVYKILADAADLGGIPGME